ncbi:MAG: squalene/phytoene synthase family protein [Candidatus Kapabacteria bacterium]|jgi:squalene synthase HpnC|nr:squalene/phytoene synthase family protein [Candidatus Kapabacteria bacterium]
MKFSHEELLDLTTPHGGRFAATTREESHRFCRRLALGHYENFPVGSLLIPRRLQQHFYSIYAFSRLADDIADELAQENTVEKFTALKRLETLLMQPEIVCGNPIFTALHETISTKAIPTLPFQKLLTAFRMDSDFRQARNYEDLEHYCAHSANPVGELVLRLFDLYTPEREPLSNAVCTGLQLANFWQDFSRDLPVGRVFIPQEVLSECGLAASELLAIYPNGRLEADTKALKVVKDRFFQCFTLLFHQTKSYFADGRALLPTIPHKRLRAELALTIAGGERILEQSFHLRHDILIRRVQLSKRDTPALLAQSARYFFG